MSAESLQIQAPAALRLRLRTLLSMPLAALVALGIHLTVAAKQTPAQTAAYKWLLAVVLGLALFAAAGQTMWMGLRKWMARICPILAAALLLLGVWEVVTTGFRLLPLPYFPGPPAVLQSLLDD